MSTITPPTFTLRPSPAAPAPRAGHTPAAAPAPLDPQRLAAAVHAGAEALLAKQRTEPFARNAGRGASGRHWCAELEGDSILCSEYILMKFILGQHRATRPDGSDEWPRLLRMANQLRLSQRPDGTWGQYPGSPLDVSACVKAYLCLKLVGDAVDAPHMARARAAIRAAGGAEKCNTFTTFYLACLGIVSWNACPAIPPQIALLPAWFPFHLRKVAAWTRTMILPLALCSALQPVRPLPPDPANPQAGPLNIDELFLDLSFKHRLSKPWSRDRLFTWNNTFLAIDRLLKLCRSAGVTPFRDQAIASAETWLLERMDPATTEGLGAIFPPMVYIQVALQKMGYPRSHPVIRQAEADLDAFEIDHPHPDPTLDHIRLQPCFSPVWDTAIALDALAEAGRTAANEPRVAEACDWLRRREITRAGDWIENLRPQDRHLRPGTDMACWAFEYRNDWYPDVDDTCMVAKALHRAGDRPGETVNRDTAVRAVRWILAMQNDDGGWAAFDRTRDRPWMEAVPFADHNAMQDPSCSDITGRVMESLVTCCLPRTHPAITQGLNYLLATQQPEGCWWGRWGCNYIYGTWQAVNGLAAAGLDARHPAAARALNWLLNCQNPDGGFGESANSYLDRRLMGQGPSTASQTGWALLTLLNLVGPDHPASRAAADWLCRHQLAADKPAYAPSTHTQATPTPDDRRLAERDPMTDRAGGWAEHWFTGTGFPKVFYLRYHLYRHSFPLKALSRFKTLSQAMW